MEWIIKKVAKGGDSNRKDKYTQNHIWDLRMMTNGAHLHKALPLIRKKSL